MATLKSFIAPTLLRKLGTANNELLFVSFKDSLQKFGIWNEEHGKTRFDYSKLADYLYDNCPADIGEKLYHLHTIAKPELREFVENHLLEVGGVVNPNDNLYELAFKLVCADKTYRHCQIIESLKTAQEAHYYISFRPTKFQETPPLDGFQVERLRMLLCGYFKTNTGLSFVEIHSHKIGKFAYYCIFHAANIRFENAISDCDEESLVRYHPQNMDILRLDCQTGELSIYTRYTSKRLSEVYKSLFAEVLGGGVMYVLNGKYNLRKLKSYDVLALGEFAAEIKTVRVVAYTELKDGCRLSYSGFVNFALFDTMERDDSEIVSATFEFMFMGSDRKYRATISNAYRSKIQTGCDEELVERFFTSKGLIRDTSYEELEILVANGAKSPAL